jgi:lipopolysaccharide biosynthesis glycosyltransferase
MKLWIGWTPAEMRAWNVAQFSAHAHASVALDIHRLALAPLVSAGLYRRPSRTDEHGVVWDVISEAPMSTEHAVSRFLVPHLAGHRGWALFTDGDVLFRHDVAALFHLADPRYAVQVVQHVHVPTETVKMEGALQTVYARKNWSSVCLWNAAHPAHEALTVEMVNSVPGRDLHRFCWLSDELIGALPLRWNYLVGHTTGEPDPAIVHFTTGVPDMPGYEDVEYANEWRQVARACGYGSSLWQVSA